MICNEMRGCGDGSLFFDYRFKLEPEVKHGLGVFGYLDRSVV